VGVHCRGGVGRSAIVAACTLVAAGLAAGEAQQRIALARRVEVPETDEQRNFIHGFRPISPM
ncbi:MAG TPA: protein-tyrosine phosphatase family protein, partial [Dehalococcoidia bacterium]|nr:protein-tyrosine phosphatase family protein [Dehalococcoidia bacterium]